MNRGSDDTELLAAFSQIVLRPFREVLKDTEQSAEEDMFALAETSEDLFFRTHVGDVLNELRQETLAIQLSFSADLRARFQAALSGQPVTTETGALSPELAASSALLACQEKWRAAAEDLSALVSRRLVGSPSDRYLGLPVTPLDLGEAYFRALDSIGLPVHAQIKTCLADVLAQRLDEALGGIYQRFADFLESGTGLEMVEEESSLPAPTEPTSATQPPENTPDREDESETAAAPDAHAPIPTAAQPVTEGQRSPAPPRMGPLEALAIRESEGQPPEAAQDLEPETIEAMGEIKAAEADEREPKEASPLRRRIAIAGAIYLLAVVLVLALYPAEQTQESQSSVEATNPPAPQPAAASPAAVAAVAPEAIETPPPITAARVPGPSTAPAASLSPSATPRTAALSVSDLDEPDSRLLASGPSKGSVAATLPEGASSTPVPRATPPAQKPQPSSPPKAPQAKRKEEAAHSKPSPSPSPSATPAPRAASAAAMRKLKLRGYDWVRGHDDNSVFMKFSLFNGSTAHIRRIRLSCAAYSDGLVRLQSVGKTLETSLAPGAKATLRHINLGRLHRNTSRISCSIENIEVR